MADQVTHDEVTGPGGDHKRWPRSKLEDEYATLRAENAKLKIILATLVKRTGQ